MKSSIYTETLRIGFENSATGISFNEIVKRLDIDLSDSSFKVNYTIWFYLNFYNSENEKFENDYKITAIQLNTIGLQEIERITFNGEKSYIKGDAINKYIDFVELQNARKSSRIATFISISSVAIAISSIVIQIVLSNNNKPPYEVIITNDRNNTTSSKFENSLDFKSGIKNMDNNQTDSHNNLDKINQE